MADTSLNAGSLRSATGSLTPYGAPILIDTGALSNVSARNALNRLQTLNFRESEADREGTQTD